MFGQWAIILVMLLQPECAKACCPLLNEEKGSTSKPIPNTQAPASMSYASEDATVLAGDVEYHDAKRNRLTLGNYQPPQMDGWSEERIIKSSLKGIANTNPGLNFELYGRQATAHGVMYGFRPTYEGVAFYNEARSVVKMVDGMPSHSFTDAYSNIDRKLNKALFIGDPLQNCLGKFADQGDPEMKLLGNGHVIDVKDIWVTNSERKFERGKEYRIEAIDKGEVVLGRCITSPSESPQISLEKQGANKGGNNIIGEYCFGDAGSGCRYNALNVTQSGSNCFLKSQDGKFLTYNYAISSSETASFPCNADSTDFYNITEKDTSCHWSQSSVNSLHHHAMKTVSILMNISNISHEEIQSGGIFKSYAHYGSSWNAYYRGDGFYYYNGTDGCIGPSLATCLDIVAHEMGHAVTRTNGNMNYLGPPGCLNEAFSDMMGDTIEKIAEGWTKNDYLIGRFCKNSGFLRSMANPPMDNKSVNHKSQYNPSMNVHHCSGIYNRAFYLMSELYGTGGSEIAFKAFLHANRFYFTPNVQWEQAACMVQKSATELGYSTSIVRTAFAQVGITITANCSTEPPPPSNGIETLPHCRWYTGNSSEGLAGAALSNKHFKIIVPAGRFISGFYMDTTTSVHDSDADLFIGRNFYPSRTQYYKRSIFSNSRERIFDFDPRPGTYGITVNGYTTYSNIKIGWCTFQ